MSYEQLLDDENLFEKEEFLRLEPTLRNTVFWNRAATIILTILTVFLFIGWVVMGLAMLNYIDDLVIVFFGGFSVLTVVTGWLSFRFFRTSQSIQRYLDTHSEPNLQRSLAMQVLSWRAFGISIFLWTVVGAGGMSSLMLVSVSQEAIMKEEAVMMEEAMMDSVVLNTPETTISDSALIESSSNPE
ncbi:MAG: hypothetical protein GY810_27135 [Aureispira sp.]|nr:hypothetical protein [Aureispira sp.]